MRNPVEQSQAPGAGPGEATQEQDGELLTIGQMVRVLHEEFPDLSISKVRYLEDRGLLAPQRTPGGYRKYAPSDIRRLRTVLTLQRDEFLPLDVIRERLHHPGPAILGRSMAVTNPLESPQALRQERQRFTWAEAVEVAGVNDSFLRQLADFRLVEGSAGNLQPSLTETDIEIARICDLLARFGVEARNLRLLRSSVEREASVIEQATAPHRRSQHADRREEGEKILQNLGALLARLFHLLLYKELRRLVE